MNEFVKGQRWISNNEPELGLGIVLEADRYQVRIAFAAAGEERMYALQSAPCGGSNTTLATPSSINPERNDRLRKYCR